MRRPSGFTLLEATVALGILALSLMAIFDITSGAVNMHAYSKKLTVASLLAREQMTDLEQTLFDEGFKLDDDEKSGDFAEQGWPNFKWRAKILAPKTQGLPPEKLLGALFNLPMGEGGDSGDPLAAMMAMFTGGAPGGGAPGGGPQPSGIGGLAGMAAPMIQGQMQQLTDQLTKSVREVHLTVYWKDGNQTESLDLVTHVVSTGPGSDRNGSNAGGVVNSTGPGVPGAPGVPGLPGQPGTRPPPPGTPPNPFGGGQGTPNSFIPGGGLFPPRPPGVR
jgi:general secretion pathway protein I